MGKALTILSILLTVGFGILQLTGLSLTTIHETITTIRADIALYAEQTRLRQVEAQRELEQARARRVEEERALERIRVQEAASAHAWQVQQEAANRQLQLQQEQSEKKTELAKEKTRVRGTLLSQGLEILREKLNRH